MADNQLIRTNEKTGLGLRKTAMLWSLLPIAAAGCAGQPTQMGSFSKNVPKEQAMVLPPPAGPGILSVIENRYDNAIAQDIFLNTSAQTPGQNLLKVQLFGTVSPFRLSENLLTSTPVTQSGVASEMRQVLPGIRMVRSAFYVQNNYGPFGYAFGHGAGNDLCMYGWQQIRSDAGTISPLANYGSIQIRLRICEADATEEKLLAVMYNFSITASVDVGGWNPYGEPSAVPSTLGQVGAPIYPRPTSTAPIVPAAPPAPSVLYTRPAPAERPVVRTTSPRPAPAPVTQQVAPVVAPPSGISIPRPGAVERSNTAPVVPGASSSANTTRPATPVIPSPSGMSNSSRVPVPSPTCTNTASGAANACR